MSNSLIFKASYQDKTLPPPYRHAYSLEVHSSKSGISVNYDLKYLDRDGLEPEEIYSEGFTLEDDFAWKGTLKPVWSDYLEEFINKAAFKEEDAESTLTIISSVNTNPQVPQDKKKWEYMLQELTQAIFEESGREAPLEITFTEISKQQRLTISFLVSFAERSLTLFENSKGEEIEKKLDWKESKNIMNTIYSIEYLGDNALLKPPKKEGKFVDIGEGAWYQFGVAAINPDKKQDLLGKLEAIFKSKL